MCGVRVKESGRIGDGDLVVRGSKTGPGLITSCC